MSTHEIDNSFREKCSNLWAKNYFYHTVVHVNVIYRSTNQFKSMSNSYVWIGKKQYNGKNMPISANLPSIKMQQIFFLIILRYYSRTMYEMTPYPPPMHPFLWSFHEYFPWQCGYMKQLTHNKMIFLWKPEYYVTRRGFE